jgi:DNA polymerase-3 subunit delta'
MPFTDIIGHSKNIGMLQQLISQGRLPHALLFTGPEGIGKRLTAFGLAKALLCEQSKNDYCDLCAACHRINQDNHPDVTIIQPEGNSIKIEQLRDWQKGLESKSYSGSWRITVIDQAEKISIGAANSILKILEEPPEDTLICLITVEDRDILSTIVSRCQILRFSPLTRSDFIRIIMQHCQLTESQSGLIYNLSKGQLSRGMAIDLNNLLHLRDQWRQFFRSSPSGEKSYPQTDKASVMDGLEIIAHWWRDVILLQFGIDDSLLTNQDMVSEVEKEAKVNTRSLVISRINLILQTLAAIERNANPKMAIDSLLLQWDNISF